MNPLHCAAAMKGLIERGGHVMHAAAIAAGICLSVTGSCFAQNPTGSMTRIETRIAPQALGRALKQFAQLEHVHVLYLTADVKDMHTSGASGYLTADEALTRLLSGTGLKYRYVDSKAISIIAAQGGGSPTDKTTAGSRKLQRAKDPKQRPVSKDADPPKTRVVQSDTVKRHDKPSLGEVVITGSRIPTLAKEGPQEVQIYDLLQIDQGGQSSLGDFISTLPSVSVTSPAVTNLDYSTTVRLRGLPVGTTLVLLDGRRLEGSGSADGQYFDLSTIPLAAVQRIEVNENGSSAIYGSDAIAGVVNIILRNNFDGFAANARYDWAKDIRNIHSSMALGKQWDRGGVSVIASYETDGELTVADRALSASNDYTSYGGTNNNYPDCFPGNVFTVDGSALPGAPAGGGASYAAVTGAPVGGTPSVSQFSYGKLNECSYVAGLSILPSTQRETVLLQGHLAIGSAATVFTEVMYTHLEQSAGEGDDKLFGVQGFQNFTVSALNPFNPFGETVGVAEDLQSVHATQDFSTEFFRPLVGIKGAIATRWHWEVSTWESIDWTRDVIANAYENASAIQGALNSADAAEALDPFTSGAIGPQSLLQPLFSDDVEKRMGRDRSVEAFIRGPVLELPAGEVQAAIGGDYVRSAFYTSSGGGTGVNAAFNGIAQYERRYDAVFGEARIPLLARFWAPESDEFVTATISGRHDQYNDFGGDTTEQMALEVRPSRSVLLRGTYGTAFSAPALQLLYGSELAYQSIVTDPTTGQPADAQVITGGNPDLRPNTGHSNTVGVVYASRAMQGLRLAVTQWHIVESSVAQSINAQTLVDNEAAFPGRVIRNSLGQIVSVNDTEVNFGSIDVSGIDYKVGYSHSAGVGKWSAELEASQTYHYRRALIPGGQALESVGAAQDDGNWAPRWKGTVGTGWAYALFSAHMDGRYTGSYLDYDSATRTIGKFWIVDANLRWSFGKAVGAESRDLTDAYIEAGATNLLNRAPQFSNYGNGFFGYDAAQMSIVGRSLYVSVGVGW